MLKEDPDDLGNLVTADNTVGCNMNGSLTDSNIPSLDDSVPMFGEMFDELMLPDGYGALLPDDISSLDSQSNKIDPFMSYRDESSETVGTPHILSPCLSKVCDRFLVLDENELKMIFLFSLISILIPNVPNVSNVLHNVITLSSL